jgi:hypothetical protein
MHVTRGGVERVADSLAESAVRMRQRLARSGMDMDGGRAARLQWGKEALLA